MAEQELIIQIDVSDSVTKLATLRQNIDLLIAQRQELAEKSKSGDEEAAKSLEKVNSAIRLQQQEYRNQGKILDGYTASKKKEADTTNFSNNSIQQNRDLLKQLTQQYTQLKNPSQAATNTIRNLTDTLKKQEEAIGNTFRNVGNYKQAIVSAFSELKGIGSVIDPIKNVGLAFQSAGGGVKGFGLALASTGIPLIISGVNLLIDSFKSFKPIADEVERVTNAIGGAFNALVTGRSITETASQAYELTVQLQELEDSQNALIISNAQWDASIKVLLVSLRNRNLTLEQGKKILSDLRKTEQAQFQQNSENAKEELRIAREQFLNKTGLYSAELDALLERGKVKRELDEEEIANLMRSGDLTREQVLNLVEQETKRQKTLAEGAEKRAKIDDKELKRIAELTAAVKKIKGDSAILNEQIDNRETQFLNSQAEKRKQIDEQRQKLEDKKLANDKAVAEEQEKLRQEQLEREQKEIDDIIKIREAAYKKQLDLQNRTADEYLKKEQEKHDKDVAATKKAEEEKIKAQEATVAAAGNIANAIVGFVETVGKAQGAGAEFAKAMALIQIAVSEAIAIANAVVAATSAGAETGVASIGVVPAYLATFIGITLGNIGQAIAILSSDTPKFAKGIIGLEGPGTETSDDIDAKLSKGESVITAKATKVFHRELAWMERYVGNEPNYQYGNRHFATGYIPNMVQGDGGFVARQSRNNGNMAMVIENAIKQGFALAPSPTLSIVELENKQSQRNRSIRVSEA